MAAIDDNKLKLVKQLYYSDGYSMKRVGESLGVSIDAVTYFMRKHKLERRTLMEDSAVRFRNKPLSYSIKKNLTRDQEALRVIGVTLYWGEGYKTEKSSGIDLANSDVAMIAMFVRFLREVCGVDEKRLRILLYCYSNQDSKKLLRFWSNITKIPLEQFTKPYVRSDFNVSMLDKMPYGMVHIRYADKKLLKTVMAWMNEIKEKYA
ncbi:MAG: hypothetical protein Q7K40_02090 [bacterium]|nr:hypothetical protein [bacterium]